MRTLMAGALALLLVFTGCSKSDAQAKNEGSKKADIEMASDKAATDLGLLPADKAPIAPDWNLETADGGMMKLSDHRGKVVILNFWDTWCPPCKAEIPDFVKMADLFEDDLVIIGAAFANNGKDAVKSFIKEYEMNYPVVYVTPQVNQMYGGISSIPTTFIIDREGRARGMHVGFKERAVFEAEVKALF
jgi:cytochrome c biogenesis protein CcmG/thiol:disulfide interchange protein DsbE